MTQEYMGYLAHHGIKGQKWGVRRFQNEDGTIKNDKANATEKEQLSKKPNKLVNNLIGFFGAVALSTIIGAGVKKLKGEYSKAYWETGKKLLDKGLKDSNEKLNWAGSMMMKKAQNPKIKDVAKHFIINHGRVTAKSLF